MRKQKHFNLNKTMSSRYLQVTYFCNVTQIINFFYKHGKKMLLIDIFGKVTT